MTGSMLKFNTTSLSMPKPQELLSGFHVPNRLENQVAALVPVKFLCIVRFIFKFNSVTISMPLPWTPKN